MPLRIFAAAILLTFAPVRTALGGPERDVSVNVSALAGGRLKLSFEHAPLLSRDFTVDEARSILALQHQSLTAPEPRGPLLATAGMVPCASGCTSVTWEKQLREDYLAKYGSPA